jgi:hypothetical protein
VKRYPFFNSGVNWALLLRRMEEVTVDLTPPEIYGWQWRIHEVASGSATSTTRMVMTARRWIVWI